MIRIQRILVPVDFSENSEKAVRYGIELARDRKAQIYFLHVVNQRLIDAVQELNIRGYQGDLIEAIMKVVQDKEDELNRFIPEGWREGLSIELLIRKGKPGEETIKVAKQFLIDLIILGTQGHSVLASTLLGSVSHYVVNRAPCPVLVIRPIEHDFIDSEQ